MRHFTKSTRPVASGTVAEHKCLVGKNTGSVYYWAERGLVQYDDQRVQTLPKDRQGAITIREALQRVSALSDMIFKSSEDKRFRHERQITQQFISEMESVCREAKAQEQPFEGFGSAPRKVKSVVVPQRVNLGFK